MMINHDSQEFEESTLYYLPVQVDAGRMERFQELLRVAVRKVKGESADLVRLGDPVGNFATFLQGVTSGCSQTLVQGLCNSHTGPESGGWEQPDVSP